MDPGEPDKNELLDKIIGRKESPKEAIVKRPRVTLEALSKLWQMSPEKVVQLPTDGKDKVRPIKRVKKCLHALSGVVQECGIPEW